MKSLELLREQLDEVDGIIARLGWNKATDLIKYYRHWLIEAICFIQMKNIAKD